MNIKNIVGLISLLLGSCTAPSTHQVSTSFYHWQSELQITALEQTVLDRLGVQQLYLRFFDLDWSFDKKEVIPVGPLQIDQSIPAGIKIIPTIFITNRTFENLEEKKMQALTEKVIQKIEQQNTALGLGAIQEIQLDCDWTQRTRAIYFSFIEEMKEKLVGVQISVTIRLHQIKFPETTGIPPADRGMLMFYNTGQLDRLETQNSILDWETASPYLNRMPDYPLALDLALPIFSWGVLFRDGKMIKLIHGLRQEDLSDSSRFKILEETRVEVVKSTYLQGYYLYQGDQLRLESVSPETLIFSVKKLRDKIANEKVNLTYYHLDSSILKHYPYDSFQQIKAALEN